MPLLNDQDLTALVAERTMLATRELSEDQTGFLYNFARRELNNIGGVAISKAPPVTVGYAAARRLVVKKLAPEHTLPDVKTFRSLPSNVQREVVQGFFLHLNPV